MCIINDSTVEKIGFDLVNRAFVVFVIVVEEQIYVVFICVVLIFVNVII
jgi:hypothetical protein